MGDYVSYKEPVTVKGLPGSIQYNDGGGDLAACDSASIVCNPDGTSVLSATLFVGDGGLLSNVSGGGGSIGTLQQVTDTGNTTSNTVQFTNTDTSFVTSGSVGILQDSPSSVLTVGNSTDQYSNVRIINPTSQIVVGHSEKTRFGLETGNNLVLSYGTGGNKIHLGIGTFNDDENMYLGTANVARVTILSTGEVGVDNLEPSNALVVGSPANVWVDTVEHQMVFANNIIIRQDQLTNTDPPLGVDNNIIIGRAAGVGSPIRGIYLGYRAGGTSLRSDGIGIGYQSAFLGQESYAIAIGRESGRRFQQEDAIAIGRQAGNESQQTRAIAIGYDSSPFNQGENSVSIGYASNAFGVNSSALGNFSNTYHDNTIALNATSSPLNTTETDALFIKPIKYGQDADTDNVSNVLSYDPDSGQVIHQYPQSTFLLATKFDSGETINKGDAVYIVAAQNDNVAEVSRAVASDPTKMPCVGIAFENFNGGPHPVVTFGKAKGIDTSAFEEGETLYVSNTVVGGLTNVKPTGNIFTANPDLIQNVGFVVKKNSPNGTIKVTGVGRTNDIPNANVLSDDSTVQYVYVNTSGNDLKKIDPALLTTASSNLQQVTDTGNVTSNTIQFTNTDTSLVTSGNVGIGSHTAGTALHVNRVGDGNLLTLERGTGGFFLSSGFDNSEPYLTYYAASGLTIGYGSVTHDAPSVNTMTLANSGNVGIGTTSPTDTLTVNGTVSMSNIIVDGGLGGKKYLGGTLTLNLDNKSYKTFDLTSSVNLSNLVVNNDILGAQAIVFITTNTSMDINDVSDVTSNIFTGYSAPVSLTSGDRAVMTICSDATHKYVNCVKYTT